MPRRFPPACARASRCWSTSHNDLGETTTVHWHGMHLPAAMDGGPHQPIDAGRHVAHRVDDRPARGDALVPPAPARRHRRARLPRARRACSCSTTTRPRRRPAARVRRRRHPADRPGQEVRRRRPARRSDRLLRRAPGILGDTILVNGTVGPVPRRHAPTGAPAAAQRLERPDLQLRASPTTGPSTSSPPTAACSPAPVPHSTGSCSPRASAPRSSSTVEPGETRRAAQHRSRPRHAACARTASSAATTGSTCSSCAPPTTLTPSPALPGDARPHRTGPRAERRRRGPAAFDAQRHDDQRPSDGHGPHRRRPSRAGTTEIWEVTNADGVPAQLPRPRRAVPGARRRRRRAAARPGRAGRTPSTSPPGRTVPAR